MTTTIAISEDVHQKLRKMKAMGDFQSYDELINFLIRKSPRRKFSVTEEIFR